MEKVAALVRRLKRAGFVLVRHGKRHDVYENGHGRRVVVGRHATDIPTGTYLSMLRDAGLSEEEQ
jgi:predicted RNA binding protein YcfA (HicA-like mRNA interferase family)